MGHILSVNRPSDVGWAIGLQQWSWAIHCSLKHGNINRLFIHVRDTAAIVHTTAREDLTTTDSYRCRFKSTVVCSF